MVIFTVGPSPTCIHLPEAASSNTKHLPSNSIGTCYHSRKKERSRVKHFHEAQEPAGFVETLERRDGSAVASPQKIAQASQYFNETK